MQTVAELICSLSEKFGMSRNSILEFFLDQVSCGGPKARFSSRRSKPDDEQPYGESMTERRIALIAGAGVYVGPDLARVLAARGHDLVLGDPDQSLVEELEAATTAAAR